MQRFPFAIAFSMAVVVATLCYWAEQTWLGAQRVTLVDQQQQQLSRASNLISRELGHIGLTVNYLRSELERMHYSSGDHDLFISSSTELLQRSSRLSEYIAQIRLLTPIGREQLRLNVHDGNPIQVPDEQLQDKSGRYYVTHGQLLKQSEIWLSPIDLNIEHGVVVTPIEITTRAVTKIYSSSNKPIALLVINYNLNELFRRLKALSTDTLKIGMLDHQGNWLISSNPGLEWQHILSQDKTSFSSTYPEIWDKLKNTNGLTDASKWFAGRPATALAITLEEGDVTAHKILLGSQIPANLWRQQEATAIGGAILAGLILYSFLISILYLIHRNKTQRQRFLEQIQQDNIELSEAQTKLQTTNTNLIRLQEELIEQSKLSALGTLVAGVGHELNTPLGGLRMTLSSIESFVKQLKSAPPERQDGLFECLHDTLAIAQNNLNKAVGVVAQFKRITETRHRQNFESFSFSGLVDDTLVTLKPLLKQCPAIQIECELDESDTCYSSPGVISQILQNLITNAIDHAFDANQGGHIQIKYREFEDQVQITVMDNGKGIPLELLDSIWQPFVTSARGQRHTGLGLYMVHQWVTKLLNGKIQASNCQTEGACFTITLPQRQIASENS